MKRVVGLLTLFSSLAFAETWNGTLVDVMCKNQDLAGHTTKCAINCSKSGYGLVLADGKFVKFDEAGNAKALAALKATQQGKGPEGQSYRHAGWRHRSGGIGGAE